jgi:hypothetical protein
MVSAGVVTQEGTYLEGGFLEAQGPEWTGEIVASPSPDECIGLVVTDQEGGQLPFLSCEADPIEIDQVTAVGYALDAFMVQNILDAVGPEDPGGNGLGLGRVVNMLNQPVEGVEVLIQEPGLTVEYLSSDMTTLDGAFTAQHGYFVVRGESPGCCYSGVEVQPSGDGYVYPFGLVPNMLTLIPVRVEP